MGKTLQKILLAGGIAFGGAAVGGCENMSPEQQRAHGLNIMSMLLAHKAGVPGLTMRQARAYSMLAGAAQNASAIETNIASRPQIIMMQGGQQMYLPPNTVLINGLIYPSAGYEWINPANPAQDMRTRLRDNIPLPPGDPDPMYIPIKFFELLPNGSAKIKPTENLGFCPAKTFDVFNKAMSGGAVPCYFKDVDGDGQVDLSKDEYIEDKMFYRGDLLGLAVYLSGSKAKVSLVNGENPLDVNSVFYELTFHRDMTLLRRKGPEKIDLNVGRIKFEGQLLNSDKLAQIGGTHPWKLEYYASATDAEPTKVFPINVNYSLTRAEAESGVPASAPLKKDETLLPPGPEWIK